MKKLRKGRPGDRHALRLQRKEGRKEKEGRHAEENERRFSNAPINKPLETKV
ncbi:MAG: hypothetical protein MZU79_03945 [Anaerotruncus sp.]|nr:hypothetical protein [Anaerotruncus sp.]